MFKPLFVLILSSASTFGYAQALCITPADVAKEFHSEGVRYCARKAILEQKTDAPNFQTACVADFSTQLRQRLGMFQDDHHRQVVAELERLSKN